MVLEELLEILTAIIEWSLAFTILPIKIRACIQQCQRGLAMLVLARQMSIQLVESS
jgi:hypothetical protein